MAAPLKVNFFVVFIVINVELETYSEEADLLRTVDNVDRGIGVGDGGRGGGVAPQIRAKTIFSGKIVYSGILLIFRVGYHVKFGNFVNFSGKYHVKFGHFVNFSCIYLRAKMSCSPKVDPKSTPMDRGEKR